MTTQEFSNEFDVLYNNIMSNQAPGLDEYEKSVFLTKAQNEIIKAYFDPTQNKSMSGFDGSEVRQIDFSKLITTLVKSFSDFSTSNFDHRTNSKSAQFPVDTMMVINETAEVTRNSDTVLLTVIPISYTQYSMLMSKPFKRPLHYQAWRVLSSSTPANLTFDIIIGPNDSLTKYTIRYVKRPTPIILTNLEETSIDGISIKTECILDKILHHDILQRAVELAKASYAGDLGSQVSLGVNSQTNLGMVSTK